MRKLAIFVLLGASIAAQAAVNLVGTWKGHIGIPKEVITEVEKIKDKKQKTQAETFMALAAKVRMQMTLNKDKTFSVTISGDSKNSVTATGTWRTDGKMLYTTTKARNGKPVPASESKERFYAIRKDGKGLLRPMTKEEAPLPMAMIFER